MKALVLILVFSLPAHAEIFKWVDENGKVHYGDRVPERYQKRADNVELEMRNPTADDVAEAEARNEAIRKSRISMESAQRSSRRKSTSRSGASDTRAPAQSYRSAQACFASCVVIGQKPPRTLRDDRGFTYQMPGGTYRDLSNCGHCENMKKPSN